MVLEQLKKEKMRIKGSPVFVSYSKCKNNEQYVNELNPNDTSLYSTRAIKTRVLLLNLLSKSNKHLLRHLTLKKSKSPMRLW